MGRAPEPHTQPLLPTLTPTLRCAPLHTLTHPTNRPASQRQQPTQTASHPPTHLQADANSRCKQTFSCPRALLNTNKHWSFLVRCFFRLISVTSEVQVRGGWVWEWECRVSWQWYGVFITGPPALSAFPSGHNKASGIDRHPRLRKSFWWASRIVGHPNGIQLGLRHIHRLPNFTVYLSQGFPLRRASLIDTIGPPA